jgi:tryptophan halogenase
MGNLESEPLAEPRLLRFTTGRRRKMWDKNVVAIGLASGFMEPLESTSIHLIQASINKLLQHFPDRTFSPVNRRPTTAASRPTWRRSATSILHYKATARDDAALWSYVRQMPIPDSLADRHGAVPRARPTGHPSRRDVHPDLSWLAVLLGQGVHPRLHPLVAGQDSRAIADGFRNMKTMIARRVDAMPSHADYMKRHAMWAQEAMVA